MATIKENTPPEHRQLTTVVFVGAVLLILSGCRMQQTPVTPDAQLYTKAEKTLSAQEYAAAQRQYRELLERFPDSRYADEAQFKVGFIYICYKNPQIHYVKALEEFKKVVKDFPQSVWVYESNCWIQLLESRLEFKDKAEQAIRKEPPKPDLQKNNDVENKLKELDRKIAKLVHENRSLNEENEKLKSVLKKLEAIDRE